MSTINRLSSVDVLQPSDQIPVWDSSNGDTRKASMSTLLAFVESYFADPDYTTRIVAPNVDGFNVDIGNTGDSSWLIVNPTLNYTTGSITLPTTAYAVNDQEITVVFTAQVSSFSITGAGATVLGAPTQIGTYDSFRVRYNAAQLTWYTLDTTGDGSGSGTSSIVRQDFTGDGVITTFALANAPAALGNELQVFIDGVYQERAGYSVSGNDLVFSEAPPVLSTIEVLAWGVNDIGATTANLVTYTPAGTGAVATTVQAKLRESVSVKDFGAVGDGVADDIAALNLATVYASSISATLVVPAGIYGISSSWNLLSNVKVQCEGTIKFLAGASGGHVVGIYNATTSLSNISWEGGAVDASNVAGQNAFGIGGFYGAVTGAKVSNVTCKNALWDNSLFGGKGFTVQHDCFDIQVSDIRIEDSSIGLSVESTNLKSVNNVNIDNIIVDNCDRFGFYGVYSFAGGIEDPDRLSCVVTNITFNNCADTYADQGVINLDRMNGLIMNNAFIRSATRVAPFRGTATNSSITFHVDAPEIEDIINLDASGGIPVGDVNLVPSNLSITATARASTQIYGELITFDATKVPINCRFDIRYETPIGPTVGLFTTGMNNTSTYKIQDVVTGKIIEGSCDNDPAFTSQYYKQFYDTQVIASSLLVQDATTETRLQPLKGELKLKDAAGGTKLITATTGVIVSGSVQVNASGPQIYSGTGVPAITAIDGSVFLRTDGGANGLYIRQSGAWVVK
jgi:hypothetical protein